MAASESSKAQKPSVIKAAAAMSMGTMASRLLGYIRDAVMLAMFSRTVTDAFVVAFRFPNLVRRLLGEGSLSVSFIPVYVDHVQNDPSGQRAQKLANSVYTLLSIVTGTLAIVAFIFMTPIMKWWVGDEAGFGSIAGKLELTVDLARIMVAYVFLVTSYAFVMGVANARNKFFVPALAPAFFNLIVIVFAMLPQDLLALPGAVLAWGVVAGGIVQFAMVAMMLYRLGHMPKWTLQIRVPGLKTVLTNLGPGLIGLGIYQVMTIANTFFAARLPEGTQSYIYASDRILELPQSIVAISLGTALLPTFSRQWAAGQVAELLNTANEALRAMLFLALPAAVGMWMLSYPIIAVLFGRGSFDHDDILVTSHIVQVYAFVLVVSSLAKVTVPGFYALKNTWLPAAVAGVCLLIHLVLAQVLVAKFGVVGLAASTAISGGLNMLILQIAFHHYVGSVGVGRVFLAVAQMTPALAVMAAFLWLVETYASSLVPMSIRLAVEIVIAAMIYLTLSARCGCPEAERTMAILRRRLKR